MSTENTYITLCIKRINQKLNLDSTRLSQRDYEYLHRIVIEKAGIDLSTATLRRLWSKQHQGVPQINTLDALARILDYDGWHEYKKANRVAPKKFKFLKIKKYLWLLLVVVLGIVLVWLLITNFNTTPEVFLQPETLRHQGVPATIGFHYNIVNATDEVQIQLSWNPNERVTLNPANNFYTGTYYYPDYHLAKLISNNTILTEVAVHITTSGWHGLLMRSGFDSNPVYLERRDFYDSDMLRTESHVDSTYRLQTKDYFSVFTLSNNILENISGDSFTLKAVIRSTDESTMRTCKQTDILIKGVSGTIRVPISSPGCYGLTELKCGDIILSGKNYDLSNLSAYLIEDQSIQISSKDKMLTIKVDDNPDLIVTYGREIGALKVIKFIFMGYGEVTQFQLLGADDKPLVDEVLMPFFEK